MPLLACDAQVVIAGSNGKITVPLSQIFDQQILLKKGEFLVQFIINNLFASLPYKSLKKTRHDVLEYPLVSVAAIRDERIRFSFGGVCPFPFRTAQIEDDLNNTVLSVEERINNAISHLPTSMVTDILGAAEYRRFVLTNTLKDLLESFEEVI